MKQIAILFIIPLFLACHTARQTTFENYYDNIVFQPDETYASTRIPALVVTNTGAMLAFCEGRIGSSSDWADMNLLMRKSTNGGTNWQAIQILDSMKGAPVGNPTPIVDDKGTIHLLYQKDYARAYHIKSNDDGHTWSAPVDITNVFDKFKPEYDWKVLAPGPGHGIQMNNGRLLSAVWLADSDKLTPRRNHHPSCVATIYSDDYGLTWHRGEIVANNSAHIKDPNESMPVQLANGTILLSIRNLQSDLRRAFSYSADGISGWSKPVYKEDLFDPTCMASIITLKKRDKNILLFSNPDSKDMEQHPRKNLTIKASFDGGNSWINKKVINPGTSGYSDLAIDKKGNVYCLYETNTQNNKGFTYSLVIKKINTAWIFQ